MIYVVPNVSKNIAIKNTRNGIKSIDKALRLCNTKIDRQWKMDQVKEEAWYICKDVVDSVVSKIMPLDFAVINQNEPTLEQNGKDNTSIGWGAPIGKKKSGRG